jgi:hypothetical protein
MIDYGKIQHQRRQRAKTSHQESLHRVDVSSRVDRESGFFSH